MARGIWENSLLKIFLTRSFLGPIFRPFLYSPEEYIHYTFLEEITMLTQEIFKTRNLEKRGLTYYWLIEAPRALFEELFISGIEKQKKCLNFYEIKTKNGTEIAFLTQGYILAILPWLREQDESFKNTLISPSMSELEEVILRVYGSKNQIFYYQHHFKLLLDHFFTEEGNEAIVRLYIENVIGHLTEISAASQEPNQQLMIPQETVNYSLWKLQNTKSVVSAMIKLLVEKKAGLFYQISTKETNV